MTEPLWEKEVIPDTEPTINREFREKLLKTGEVSITAQYDQTYYRDLVFELALKRLYLARETLRKLLAECLKHNGSYHHVTDSIFLREVGEFIDVLDKELVVVADPLISEEEKKKRRLDLPWPASSEADQRS